MGIIDLNQKKELENFIGLSSLEASIFFDLNDKYTIDFLKEVYFGNIKEDKRKRLIEIINDINDKSLVGPLVKLLLEFSKDKLWDIIENNAEHIDYTKKIDAIKICMNYLSSNLYFEEIVKDILLSVDGDLVKLYISLLTDNDLIYNKYYVEIVRKLVKVKNFERLRILVDLVLDENFLNSNHVMHVLDNALSIKDNDILDAYSSLVYVPSFLEFANYRYFTDLILEINDINVLYVLIDILAYEEFEEEYFECVVKNIKNCDVSVLSDFKKAVLDDNTRNSNYFSFILERLCSFSNSYLSSLYLKIVTNEDILNNDKCVDVIDLVSKMKNKNTLMFVSSLIQDSDLSYDNSFIYILKMILKNKDRFYSNSFYNILTNEQMLRSSEYYSYINKLFTINDESILTIISDFILWDSCDFNNDSIHEFLRNVFNIRDVNFLREYINIVTIEEILNDDNFDIIFNKALHLKSPNFVKLYIDLVSYIILNEDEFDFDFELVLDNIVKFNEEEQFKYFMQIIQDSDLHDSEYLNDVILCFNDVNVPCLSYFVDIILDRDIILSDSYYNILSTVSSIVDVERIKLLDNMLNSSLGVVFFNKVLNIEDIRVLKDLCLLLDDFDKIDIDEMDASLILRSYLDMSKDNRVLKNLIRSKNPVLCNYKSILFRRYDVKRCDFDSDLGYIPFSDIDVVKGELYDLSIMYGRVSLYDVLNIGTNDDIINSLSEIDENEEVSENILVKKLK